MGPIGSQLGLTSKTTPGEIFPTKFIFECLKETKKLNFNEEISQTILYKESDEAPEMCNLIYRVELRGKKSKL